MRRAVFGCLPSVFICLAPAADYFSPTSCPPPPSQNYESFVTGEFRVTNPEIQEDIDANPHKVTLQERLVYLMGEQIRILAPGVHIHGNKCSEQMLPLHEHIKSALRLPPPPPPPPLPPPPLPLAASLTAVTSFAFITCSHSRSVPGLLIVTQCASAKWRLRWKSCSRAQSSSES